jgi:DNA-binding NtrC family response regulator
MNATGDKRSQCVMIIDDDCNVLDVVKICLEMGEFTVLAYDTPLDALAAYKQCWREIDLVLIDYHMPQMNGAVLFDKLRELNPAARVVMLSGSGDNIVDDLLSQGIYAYIHKPFYLDSLIQQVRDAIAAP